MANLLRSIDVPLRRALGAPTLPLAVLVLVLAGLPAGAAQATPVFTIGGLSPEVISPNDDLVQDFVVINYTIAVDTASVTVRLTPVGGGSTLAVLQPLTRQGRGPHTVVYDGLLGGVPLEDGAYEVVVFGVGSEAEGEETITLALSVDSTPPTVLSLDLIEPQDGVIRNGDTVVADVCIAGDPETVTADFSALDLAFSPGAVSIQPLDETCLRISYTVSAGNNRIDAANIPIVITGIDSGGNRDAATLEVCLSNAPPTVVEARLLNEFPIFQNGDRIEAEISFLSSALVLSVGADLSALDSEFDPGLVAVQNLGNKRFRVSYTISAANTQPDGDYVLKLFAQDPGCGLVTDSTLTVSLDNQGDFAAVISDVSLQSAAFSPNGDGVQDRVTVSFTTLEDTIFVQIDMRYTSVLGGLRQQAIIFDRTPLLKGPHTFDWDGSTIRSSIDVGDIPDQTIEIIVLGTSTDADRRRNKVLPLVVDRVPPQLKSFAAPSRGLRDGQVLELQVTYDQPGLTLIPNFANLDTRFSPSSPDLAVNDNGNGSYNIAYRISGANARTDGARIPVPITARDPAGNSAVSSLAEVCLSNNPPRLVEAEFITGSSPFTRNSEILIRARWSSDLLPLEVSADFSQLDSGYETGEEIARDTGDGLTFTISYKLSGTNSAPEGENIPLVLSALDAGCGVTDTTAFRVGLDKTAPAAPRLDALGSVVREPRIRLSGQALDATRVEILRGGTVLDTLLTAGGLFDTFVDLNSGVNVLTAIAIDGAGNRSTPSEPREIFFVDSSFLRVPGRFAPGDAFSLGLLVAADEVTIRIYNLEGVEIRRLEGGTGDLFDIPWDGRDNTGNLGNSGPYIAVAEIRGPGGGLERLRQAFVFTRKGGAAP